MRPLKRVTSVGSKQLAPFMGQSLYINPYWLYLRTLFACDPLMNLLDSYHYRLSYTASDLTVEDRSVRRLRANSQITYLQGLRIAFGLLGFRTQITRRIRRITDAKYPVWKPRYRARVSGVLGIGIKHSKLGTSYSDAVVYGFSDVTFQTTTVKVGASTYDHFSFDDCKRLALKFRDIGAVDKLLHRALAVGQFARCRYYTLSVSDTEIRYNAFLSHNWTSGTNRFVRTTVTVIITRGDVDSGVSIQIAGFNENLQYWAAKPKPTAWYFKTHFFDSVIQTPKEVIDPWRNGVSSLPHTIMGARSVLYQTQSEAYGKCIYNFGSTWETLVESGSTLNLINEVLGADGGKLLKKLRGTPANALVTLTEILSGMYLTYSFAAKPTYEQLVEVVQQLDFASFGEAGALYEGLPSDFANLPNSFHEYCYGFVPRLFPGLSVHSFQARFQTEVILVSDVRHFASFLLGNPSALGLGSIPTPSGVWQSSPLSFAIDWPLNIGPMIESAENLANEIMFGIYRVGHSVNIKVQTKEGPEVRVFLRSAAEQEFVDPVLGADDSWYNPDYPLISIPLAVSLLTPAGRKAAQSAATS